MPRSGAARRRVAQRPPDAPGRAGRVGIALACLVLLLIGGWLRLRALPWHQNLWAVDWLAYFEPQARDLRRGWLPGWLLSWEGLHPPLSGAIHGLGMALGFGQVAHWAATVAASLAAPVVLGLALARRSGRGAALLLIGWCCLSPLQANYGLNTSPYPWALLLVAASTAGLLRALERDTPRAWLISGLLSAAAAQVHILAFAAVIGQALVLLFLRRRAMLRGPVGRGWAIVAASAALVVGASLLKTSDPWTFHIDGGDQHWSRQAGHMLRERFLPLGAQAWLAAAAGVGAVLALANGPRRIAVLLLLQAVGYLAALALFYELHVADPRLTHYFIVPQLLVLAAGAMGWASLSWRGAWLGGLLLTLPWGAASWSWHDAREAEAQALVADSAAEAVRGLYEQAGEGDAIAYLWDYRFLNDEPEVLDPLAARWPTARLGRPCFAIEEPRQLCNAHGGSTFYFAPHAFTGAMADQEEELRLMINTARPPGRATLVVVPSPEAPPRPWPMEPWLAEQGGEVAGPLPGGVLLFRFPPGTVVPDPPPLHSEPAPEPEGGE